MKTTSSLPRFATLATAAFLAFAAAPSSAVAAASDWGVPFKRGMGFRGYYDAWEAPVPTAQILENLKAKGFDHIRLPVDFRSYSSYNAATGVATLIESGVAVKDSNGNGSIESAGFATFDRYIDLAEAAGMHIMLDFHGWFSIDPTSAGDRAQFKALWKAVAERYKDRSGLLVFELMNEPNTKSYASLNSLQKEAIAVIRETNPTRLVLFTCGDAGQPWILTDGGTGSKIMSTGDDPNLAIAIHVYNPAEFTHQGAWGHSSTQVALTSSHISTLNWNLEQLKKYRAATGVPVVVNEFGVCHIVADTADVTQFLAVETRFFESNNIAWTPWVYCSPSRDKEFSVVKSNGAWYDYIEAGIFPDGPIAPFVPAAEPAPPPVVAETEGFDNTNRLFAVTGLEAGQTATLEICGDDASSSHVDGTATAVADSSGAASFDFPTVPGTLYRYSLSVGGETVASGTFLAGSWDAAGSWFATAPDGSGGIRETGGSWTTPPVLREGGNAFVSGEAAVFSLSSAAAAAGNGRLFRAEARVAYPEIQTLQALSALSPGDTLAVVAPVAAGEGGAAQWAACIGGAWTPLAGGPEPVAGTYYAVRLEGDFAAASPRIRLSVSADGGATFEPLSAAGADWFAPNDAGNTGLSQIEAQGALEIASLGGTLADGAVAEAGGVRYATLSDALRAAGRGGAVTLLANATAPASLLSGRTVDTGGHALVSFDDLRGTLLLLQ